MRRGGKILVYNGPGASLALITAASLKAEVDETVNPVVLVDADDVRKGNIFQDAVLFALAGGRDKPYCEELNGIGTRNIAQFARRKAFIGWCAGAYFGASRIEFHKGLPDEVIADRELALFPGRAIGSLVEFGIPYNNRLQSVATPLVKLHDGSAFKMYYHGGASFLPDDGVQFDGLDGGLSAVARFADLPGEPVCIARTNHAEGGKSILSGVHFELPSSLIVGQLAAVRAGKDYAGIGKTLAAVEKQRRSFFQKMLYDCGVTLAADHRSQLVMNLMREFLPLPVFEEMQSYSA